MSEKVDVKILEQGNIFFLDLKYLLRI
jgi:hypothetical protein